MPPEALNQKSINCMPSIDVWSMGCILYEMIEGVKLFEGKVAEEITDKILKFKYKYDTKITPEANDLLEKMLKINPLERITIKDCLKHPWVLGHINNYNNDNNDNNDNINSNDINSNNPVDDKYMHITHSEPNLPRDNINMSIINANNSKFGSNKGVYVGSNVNTKHSVSKFKLHHPSKTILFKNGILINLI